MLFAEGMSHHKIYQIRSIWFRLIDCVDMYTVLTDKAETHYSNEGHEESQQNDGERS